MCVVNVGEVYYTLQRVEGTQSAQAAMQWLLHLDVRLHDANMALVMQAAALKAQYPLSYADCFAAALAQQLEASVVTGDPEFRALEGVVDIEWI